MNQLGPGGRFDVPPQQEKKFLPGMARARTSWTPRYSVDSGISNALCIALQAISIEPFPQILMEFG